MGKRKKVKWKQGMINYSFVMPAVIFMAVFMIYPIWYNIEMSLKNVDLKNFLDSSSQIFIGLENYKSIFQDKYF